MIKIILADLSLPKHAQAIISLLDEYAQDPMGGGAQLPAFVRANLIAELKKRQGVYVIMAMLGDNAAGMAICFEGFSTFACKPLLNIHDVIVSANHRGRGIAKQLLAKAEEIAINSGCCKLTLEVLEGNITAQAAYKACGFAGYELDPIMGKAMFWQKNLIQ
ncbi:MAG: GNAT family N-acetyltransferase [Methylobacter sp.]|uniref:GNAT family N-acetyltransferase n=1 Tax=Methylovulum miyakonense TaxID=645578 RepID=UPI00036457DA|nr:GNAT family N-acetyltransferase [Methylovulum miyakonense]PPD42916.1 MAG: GNAT family N-acetyltransferase [Methylobacter sp.]